MLPHGGSQPSKILCYVLGLMAIICGLFVFCFIQILHFIINREQTMNVSRVRNITSNQDTVLIVWWNFMPKNLNYNVSTEVGNCQITADHSQWKEANMILFYGSEIETENLPLPRPRDQLWGLFHEESNRFVPFIPYTEWLQFFNYTATFSRYSDFSFPTYYLPSYEDLVGHEYLVPISEKKRNSNFAPILFLNFDCSTITAREDYVRELMDYIDIDSFGTCLNNRDLPKRLGNIQHNYSKNLYTPELMKLIGNYRYLIAYENSICDDYITENFWQALVAGTVPIYFGTPTVKDWSPNPESYIDISKFNSPAELVDLLDEIEKEDRHYRFFLDHKYGEDVKVDNYRLLQELHTRQFYIGKYKDLLQKLDENVCKNVWNVWNRNLQYFGKTAGIMDYSCITKPQTAKITEPITHSKFWSAVMSTGHCEAKLLNKLLRKNKPYSVEEYNQYISKIDAANDCLSLDIY